MACRIDQAAADSATATDPGGARAVAERLGVDFVEALAQRPPSAEFVRQVPIGHARAEGLLGLESTNGVLPVAVAELKSWEKLDVVGRWLGKAVVPVLTTPRALAEAINLAYQQREGQAHALIDRMRADVEQVIEVAGRPEDLLDTAGRAPVIELVNLMLFEAVRDGASDVHVQPYDLNVVVRMRIDGILFDAFKLPKERQEEVVSRIKVMGKMNIAEKRLAQDGRTTVQVGDRVVDLRLSVIPTSFGERVVIRLLDKSARLYELPELGMDKHSLARFEQLIRVEHGLILVTGPTGSGKSTTLYAALQQINSTERNILTLEDPIEYQLPGISQTQVSDRKGMTFAGGLRSVLRQDPDIIMVGEIRDHETAVMAIQSALTGHLVFSTLHTNDAASAITRLLDLGIESYLVASSLVGVLAQRLVRRVCDGCGQPVAEPAASLARLGVPAEAAQDATFRSGAGCDRCRGIGYSGRVGLFELLVVNEPMRRRIGARDTAAKIKTEAMESGGMRSLQEDGLAKAMAGGTTLEEVARVTMRATSE